MENTIDVIYTRRAVRKYKDQEVNKMLIDTVIAAGRMAPSAMNRQPWKFYILNDKEFIRSCSKAIVKATSKDIGHLNIKDVVKSLSTFHLSDAINFVTNGDPIFHGAPAVIFLTSPEKYEWGHLDVGMCAENMMLAAKSLGLDTCPVGLAKYIMDTDIYHKLLIPDNEEVLLAIILGYGDEEPTVHERTRDNAFYIN